MGIYYIYLPFFEINLLLMFSIFLGGLFVKHSNLNNVSLMRSWMTVMRTLES